VINLYCLLVVDRFNAFIVESPTRCFSLIVSAFITTRRTKQV